VRSTPGRVSIACSHHALTRQAEEVFMGLDDKIKNAAQDIAGKAKEAVGDRKGDDDLKAEGRKDQTAASAKKTGEDVKDVFK
jgi:uncharacterized protein YjbJ (UPF0337 family)